MNCDDSEILLNALIDDELDAGHAHDVEKHVAACSTCAAKLTELREMHDRVGAAGLKESAPPHLRERIEAALPFRSARVIAPRKFLQPSRRTFFGGFAVGTRSACAGRKSCPHRGGHRSATDHRQRSRVGPHTLAPGWASDRRGNERPAHSQNHGSTVNSTLRRLSSTSRRRASGWRPPIISTASRWLRLSINAANTLSICSSRNDWAHRTPAQDRGDSKVQSFGIGRAGLDFGR